MNVNRHKATAKKLPHRISRTVRQLFTLIDVLRLIAVSFMLIVGMFLRVRDYFALYSRWAR